MKVYETGNIRNVVVMGHGGCGKTTLVEAIAYQTGITARMGKVTDGNTISDYDKEEQKRQFSISTSVVPVEFEDIKINFLDTPGYFDFVGEVEEACHAAGAAVIVINGKSGVEVGTLKAWELCEKYKLPRLFFVTGMDDDQASYRKIVLELNDRFGRKVAPFHVPIRENEKFVGFVNVVKMKGRRFINDTSEYEECDIPDYMDKHLNISRDALVEAVADTSEELMERYFAGEEFTYEEVSTALRTHVMDCQIVPVLVGSGVHNQGTSMLMNVIKKYFPSPEYTVNHGKETSTGELVMVKCDQNKHLSAKVFKTVVDPFIGKYSLIKVVTGTLKAGDGIYNVNKGTEDRASKLYLLRGKETIEVPELRAGDIGALAKIEKISTGDTISTKGATLVYDGPQVSKPYTCKAYRAKNKSDEDKINGALARMVEEDQTLRLENDVENHQTLIYGIGDQQLDVVASRILNRYKVEIELYRPKVAYRETLRKKVQVQGKYKKQTGGSGQYGDVHMVFEPSGDLDTPYDYMASYITALDLCLQGVISPSTLGIDTKKLDNAEAQREKEKTTLYTRNAIVKALQEVLPGVVSMCINADNILHNKSIEEVKVNIPFGEYANPSFESQVETVAKAKQGGIMSIERCVEELYGDTLDDHCKEEEIARLKAEQGIQDVDEPGVNLEAGNFKIDLEGGGDNESKGGKQNIPDEPKEVPGVSGSSKGAGTDGRVRSGKE